MIGQRTRTLIGRLSLAVLMMFTFNNLNVAAQQTSQESTPVELVDINSASVEQIEEIVGDETLAERIVEGRPYANKRQLLTRSLVTEEEYEMITDRIVARRVQTTP